MHIFYVIYRPKKVIFCELVVVLFLQPSYNDTVGGYFTKYWCLKKLNLKLEFPNTNVYAHTKLISSGSVVF